MPFVCSGQHRLDFHHLLQTRSKGSLTARLQLRNVFTQTLLLIVRVLHQMSMHHLLRFTFFCSGVRSLPLRPISRIRIVSTILPRSERRGGVSVGGVPLSLGQEDTLSRMLLKNEPQQERRCTIQPPAGFPANLAAPCWVHKKVSHKACPSRGLSILFISFLLAGISTESELKTRTGVISVYFSNGFSVSPSSRTFATVFTTRGRSTASASVTEFAGRG